MEHIPSYIWTTRNIYVDIDTGEEITKYTKELNNYITLKKTKHVKYDKRNGKAYVEITNECRQPKYRDQELPFDYK